MGRIPCTVILEKNRKTQPTEPSEFSSRDTKSPGAGDVPSERSSPPQPLPTLQRTLSRYAVRREQCLYFWNLSFFPRFLSIVRED